MNKKKNNSDEARNIIFLVGPTAIGKSEVSLHLAKLLNAEIISCDSMQVYKGMDIGTQKVSLSDRKKAPHHLIDVISPSRIFSVADFRKKALSCIEKIHKKNKQVLFVGGTALYMKALVDGLFPSPEADKRLRKQLLSSEKKNYKGFLHKKLKKVDSKTAKLLHPNDTRRIIRALEIYINTNIPMSELKKKTKGLKDNYNIKIFCLNQDRDTLYENINKRVDRMFRRGLLAECKRLKIKRLSSTAGQALGYKEVFAYLNKKSSLSDAKELIKRSTRNFAKRQLSWFRNDKRIIMIDIDNKAKKEIIEIICKKSMM